MAKTNHRAYENDYPSVTTVLGVLRKAGLEAWFKYTPLAQIKRETDEGKLIGTQIHDAIQQHIEQEEIRIETEYAAQVMNALKGFMQFRKEHPEIKPQRAEIQLTSIKHRFNGTTDALAMVNDNLVLLDWKTGKAKSKDRPDIYDEYKYQVAAYVYLYNEVYEATIDTAYILALAKDKVAYNLIKMEQQEIRECFEEVFLPCLRILTYQRKEKTYGL